MKRRTSVLLDEHVYERLQRRAHAHGRTVSDEIRVALDASLAQEPAANADRKPGGPNQGLLDSIAVISPLIAESGRSIPPAADPGFKKWLRDSIAEPVGEPVPGVGGPNAGLLNLAGAFSGASHDAQWVDSDEFSAELAFEARGPHPAAPPR